MTRIMLQLRSARERIYTDLFFALFAKNFVPFAVKKNNRKDRQENIRKVRKGVISFIIFCLVLSVNYSFSQNNVIDSLNTLLKTVTHDTTRLRLLVELSEECELTDILKYSKPAVELAEKLLRNKSTKNIIRIKNLKASALNNIGFIYDNQGQMKEALEYYNMGLKIRKEIGDKQGIAASLNNIGLIYDNHGQVKEALNYYSRSLNLFEEIRNSPDKAIAQSGKRGIAYSLNNIGVIYNNQGQVKEALDYYDRSLKLHEEIGDKRGVAYSLNNIGFIYNNQGQVKEALNYYGRSLKLYEVIGDKKGIATSLNNIGMIYNNQGQVEVAIEYYGRSLKYLEEIGDKMGIAGSLNNIGFIYNNKGLMKVAHPVKRDSLFNMALDYFARSLSIREEIGDKQGISYSLNNIGGIYFQQKKYLLARSYCDSSLSLAKKLGYPENIRNAELTLAKIDSARGNPAGAYEHYKLYIVYRDSIKNKENEKAAIRQQTKYEFEKVLLVKEQEEKEKKRILVATVERRDRIQYSVTLIVIVVLLSFVMLIGKIKVNQKVAEGLIFFVFLILFEFILVLADPYIENFTGGAPGYKLLFNAIIAALIFPLHAFFEKKLKRRLMKHNTIEHG